MTELRDTMRLTTLPDSTRVLVVDTDIPDDAPADVREGLARRRIANGGETCPCGGGLRYPNRAARRKAAKAGKPIPVGVWHEPDCPASDDVLLSLLRAWAGGGA
ncbi:MAG: hypothetical protein ACRD0P_40465 [Stackebrandtia sp.]